MIINLRGASCSGKSTPIYRLLDEFEAHVTPLIEPRGWNLKKERVVGYEVGDLLIIGPYEPTAKTGGMDMLTPGKIALVTQWLKDRLTCGYKHVIFESLMCSLAMGRYMKLADEVKGGPAGQVAFCFLNTPLEVREERIMKRNGGLGPTGKGINVEATLHHQHVRMKQIRQKFVDDSRLVYDIDWRDPYGQIQWLLDKAGWDERATPQLLRAPVTLFGVAQDLVQYGSDSRFWPADDPKEQTQLGKELLKEARAFHLTPEDMLVCQQMMTMKENA